MTLPELALRFILANPDVHTTIPGMRKLKHVEANLACSLLGPLAPALLSELRRHRWDRQLVPETFARKVRRKLASFLPHR